MGPLQKYLKFRTILNCAKKYYLAKLFIPLIKRSVSPIVGGSSVFVFVL